MKQINIKFVFNRRKKLKADGSGTIELEAHINGVRKFKSTGYSTLPKLWDRTNQRVKASDPNSLLINTQLQAYRANIENEVLRLGLAKKKVGIEIVDSAFAPEASIDLIDHIKDEIGKTRNSQLTISSYNNTLNHLTGFLGSRKIKLDEIDFNFLDDLHTHLSIKLAPNTVHKIFKNLKVFLELAQKRGLISSYPKYSVKKETVHKKILMLAEVEKIAGVAFEEYENTTEQIRDMFLFGCYTGLRISDVTKLRWDWLRFEADGLELEFKTNKAKKIAKFNLRLLFPNPNDLTSSRPEALIHKYKGRNNELIFPSIAQGTINRHLKTIATLAEISNQLTFKNSRDFFGTYMSTKVATTVLMRLMQHSDIKTTMQYVRISEQLIKEGLMKVDW